MRIDYFDAVIMFVFGLMISYLGLLIDSTIGIIVAILYIGSIIVGKLSNAK